MPMGGENSGFGMLGMLIMPASILMIILKQPKGPISRLIKAGAVDESRARKLETLDIPRAWVVDGAVQKKIIRRTSDGRYWVDLSRNRRYRWRLAITWSLVMIMVSLAAWFLWPLLSPPAIEEFS